MAPAVYVFQCRSERYSVFEAGPVVESPIGFGRPLFDRDAAGRRSRWQAAAHLSDCFPRP